MTGWQSIETAPRDGTDVLLWDGQAVELGHWLDWDDGLGDWVDGTGDWVDGELLPLRPTPTHWRPLPPPPGEVKP